MQTVLVVVHVFLSVGLIILILIQHGKGADAGAAFGSGASATVFGAQGSANFLSRTTGILAALFFLTSLGLAWLAMRTDAPKGVMEALKQEQAGAQVMAVTPPPASEVPMVPGATLSGSEIPVVEAKPEAAASSEAPPQGAVAPTQPADGAAAAVVEESSSAAAGTANSELSPGSAVPSDMSAAQSVETEKTGETPVVPGR